MKVVELRPANLPVKVASGGVAVVLLELWLKLVEDYESLGFIATLC